MLIRTLAVAASLALSPLVAAAQAGPDFADRQDFDFAGHGYVGTRADPVIKAADGHVVWDLSAYDFLKGPAPKTADPSLWRHAQLLAKSGLFQVSDRIWQVRGFDLANLTFIKGDTGWILIDPLTSVETANAALDLANEKLGARPVVAVIYTHSHTDHFGGARGVVSQADVDAGKVKVIAPQGFLEHAVSENIIAGPAMARRAVYQFGVYAPPGPAGQLNAGIGMALSKGTQSLVPPNVDITRTGQELVVDGVRIQFQMTPGTEAPAEMNLYFPDWKVLCLAENANVTLHNILTPRGALVRDAKAWADDLSESIRLYGDKTDVMFTSHGWPRFGAGAIDDFLEKHRDAYKFLHDQSVRLMNEGLTGTEIANRLTLPPVLAREWYNRGYYGSMSFNSRAVYQRYMGWYDGDPAHLAPLDPAEEARRTVTMMGGPAKVIQAAKAASTVGDDRWAATLLDKVVFADAGNKAAREALAGVYDRMGQQTENAIWRNMYLSASAELRGGIRTAAGGGIGLDLIRNTPTPMLLDLMSVRLDPAKVGDGAAVVDLVFPDRKEHWRVTVRNQVLTYEAEPKAGKADAVITLPRQSFLLTALGGGKLAMLVQMGDAKVEGDAGAYERMTGWLTAPKPDFPLVWR